MSGTAQATEPLFSYGTLQTPSVQYATFGRLLSGVADTLPGYAQSMIEIDDAGVVAISGATHHPVVRYTGNPEHSIAGMVFHVTESELQRADAYETGDYARVSVMLASGTRAWMYVQKT